MKRLTQLFVLAFIVTLMTSCYGQTNSEPNEIQKQNPLGQAPPELPENLKKQSRIIKQIYSLQRELRDLRIKDFINDINQYCKISGSYNEIEFFLEQRSGKLIEYKVDGKKIEIDCIQDRLVRIQNKFGEMSNGFNNAFRMRPTTKFVVLANKNKK